MELLQKFLCNILETFALNGDYAVTTQQSMPRLALVPKATRLSASMALKATTYASSASAC